ncbi:ATP-grasp domain-containing protein [Angustibacter luteus]|uniref:ATP-grasp domain-containing protein n=1 Tax=Angustibacter luteus TaxID=658456 RepID=A0ABW1JHT6_9ACTN
MTTAASTTASTVAVTGAGGPAGVNVVLELTRLGHRVLALDTDPWATGLALADVGAIVPRGDAPGYAQAVVQECAQAGATTLICTVVEEYPALHAAAPDLQAAGIASWIPSPQTTTACADKGEFAASLQAAGVAHPHTSTVVVGDGPWVVKPRTGRGSRDVTITADRASAERALEALAGSGIVQQQVIGREWTADCLTDRTGRVLAVVPRWRVETKAGISTKGETFHDPAVVALVTATLHAVGLTGVANAQGFVTDDVPVAVEVNPRFSGGLSLSLAAGADLVGGYVELMLDPDASIAPDRLTWQPGRRMQRYFEAVYSGGEEPVSTAEAR